KNDRIDANKIADCLRCDSFQDPSADDFCKPQSITRILSARPFRPHNAGFTNELLLGRQQIDVQDSVDGENHGTGTNKSNAAYVLRGGWKAERIAVRVRSR